jgi:hypothetical protein
MVFAETKTVILDGRNLTGTATEAESSITQDDIKYTISKGAKAISKYNTSETEFADVTKCILIGKKNTYIYNQTPFGAGITKFEIYTNAGSASEKVTTEISFSETPITESSDNKIEIGTPTKDAIKEIENIPENAKYFYWTITSDNPAQVAFRITYELESEPEATPVENVYDKAAGTTKKILENGQILIIHDGKKYNLNGQTVE